MDMLPMALRSGNVDYQATIQTIVNCQELVNMFENNDAILPTVAPMLPGMSSHQYNILLRHRKLLSRIMHRISTTLQVEQLELSRAIQCMLEDN
jgi:hypothetical protein